MNTNPELIKGIYNYCDAWCERCLFTSRCQSFQLQHETGLANPLNPGDKLIQQLTEALNLTRKYVENLTQTQSVAGPDAPQGDQIQTFEAKAIPRLDTANQFIEQLARDYLHQTGHWLTQEKDFLELAGQQQIRDVGLGLRTQEEAMPILHALKDAWEMIRWYRTLIPVKTQAVLRAMADPIDDVSINGYYSGKAKLILVSIDRSLLAWQTILIYSPEKTDDLLDSMALLSRLRRELETLFPDARAFKRPGLD